MILPLSNNLDSFKYTLNIYNVQGTGINKGQNLYPYGASIMMGDGL